MSSSDANRRILLIDDEPDLCRIVKVTLERLKGWEILTADSIQAGLTQAEGKQPDVILLDLTLDGNGLTLLQTLKNNLATQAIPVILFTATNPSEDSLDFNPADIAGIILKPFSVLLLADQIIEQLGW
ncbi:MAG: response regulator [Nostoc sp.]|jgi:two-component system OmpR family response regulator|uniref:response regulator n=1 Tax=unclassified Nostoc TaxID=2593658 RepID=UPI001DF3FE9C|nr:MULTISPECIES: response regulator [unclassified Nostoc]MBN3880149.1 response regulator [Nostoc sp. JL23]MBN3892808.1 response regulator [Nostoc sp. JL31]